MVGDDAAILLDDDAIGVGLDLDGSADGTGVDRVPVVIKAHEAGLGDRCRQRMEAVEAAGMAHEMGPLGLEHLPHGPVRLLGMSMRLGVSHASFEQQAVQLIVALHA